jgi:hypothetical protein
MDRNQYLAHFLRDDSRTSLVGMQLVAKMLVPQPRTDIGQGYATFLAACLQPAFRCNSSQAAAVRFDQTIMPQPRFTLSWFQTRRLPFHANLPRNENTVEP